MSMSLNGGAVADEIWHHQTTFADYRQLAMPFQSIPGKGNTLKFFTFVKEQHLLDASAGKQLS
jgi:hypothetical protein